MRTIAMVAVMAMAGCFGGELQDQLPEDELVDVAADVCSENDEDTANSPYTGAWCGFTSAGKSHGCCNGAECSGAPSPSGSLPGRCCYCITPSGACGSYNNCVNQTPKVDCTVAPAMTSPYCTTCSVPADGFGHDPGPDGICNNSDDVY